MYWNCFVKLEFAYD
uniref:Uncharacterized protein n=1 Tax=Rhizophora mucronata TaxID=61149 RepID=A0A2P2NCQ1_RHIMU